MSLEILDLCGEGGRIVSLVALTNYGIDEAHINL